jgi:hypothetical protein
MADIRPAGSGLPQAQTPARGPNPARVAAQRAFFNAAMGQAQAAAPGQPQPQAPTQAARAATPTAPVAAASATVSDNRPVIQVRETEAPTRYLRPGSLLDIKV